MGIEVRLPDILAVGAQARPRAGLYGRQFGDKLGTKEFEISDLPQSVSWDEFDRKGYHIINVPENYRSTPALRWYAEGRACDTPDPSNPKRLTDAAHELGTDSGKLEFVSQSLSTLAPEDDERPPLPHYLASWEGHRSALSEKYPLQLISPHPRFSFHTHYDKHASWLDEIPGHRVQKNGHCWWPAPSIRPTRRHAA